MQIVLVLRYLALKSFESMFYFKANKLLHYCKVDITFSRQMYIYIFLHLH